MPRLLRALLALALTLVAALLVVTLRARGWSVVPDLVLLGLGDLAIHQRFLFCVIIILPMAHFPRRLLRPSHFALLPTKFRLSHGSASTCHAVLMHGF